MMIITSMSNYVVKHTAEAENPQTDPKQNI